jgi:predicted phosphodiesterase
MEILSLPIMKKKYLIMVMLGVVVGLLGIGCLQQNVGQRPYTVKDPTKTHYIVVSDIHWYDPYGLKITSQDIPDSDNTLYLGDIYDAYSAKKRDVREVFEKIRQFKLAKGERYLRGNHELSGLNTFLDQANEQVQCPNGASLSSLDYTIRSRESQNPQDRILFLHGHKCIDPHYDPATIKKWETGTSGSGGLKRLGLRITNFFRPLVTKRPTAQEITNAIRLAVSMNCRTIVFGHTHVCKVFDQQFQDQESGATIRVITVPRGVSHLELLGTTISPEAKNF